jgi:N-acetyl-gamma-glutamyl-phosphate reductase
MEAASWVEKDNDRTVLIDASTAFRVNDDWVYGFPELSKEQRTKLQTAKRISNPGCYPTGFIALTRPLTDAGILPKGTPVTVNAISGYSGGGKGLMKIFESSDDHEPWGTYGLSLKHKHVPEMAKYSGLGYPPIFQPAVATFAQGMVVSVPLHYQWLKAGTTGQQIHDVYTNYYKDSNFVEIMPLGESAVKDAGLLERGAFLAPDQLANTNKLQLFIFANDDDKQVLLVARLDNLGKGASGAAVQNLNIALGFDETIGLI